MNGSFPKSTFSPNTSRFLMPSNEHIFSKHLLNVLSSVITKIYIYILLAAGQ